MTPPWGINWLKYHQDMNDMPHIEKMGYASFTIYEWMWNNRDFCNELLSVARKDAIFLDRDHPMSEQKDDQWKNDPAGKGRAHADDWAQKVKDGKVFTPIDRTYFLGLNEPNSNVYQRQIDAYNEAYCRRLAEHGLRAAAYSFGVGHPSTIDLDPKKPPDWHWYQASAAAILEGHHIVATHEYGVLENYGWGYWCGRIAHCPHPFTVVFDECGIDHGVVDGNLYGYQKYINPLAAYCDWLDGFQIGQAERAPSYKVKVHSYNIFCYDFGRSDAKDWVSYDIRPIRPALQAFQWTVDTPTPPPPAPTTTPETAYVAVPRGANLRKAPSVDGDLIVSIPYGEKILVYPDDTGANWSVVEYQGNTGYMSSSLYTFTKPHVTPTTGTGPTEPVKPVGDNWQRSREFVRIWEGGWADNPADPGGATNKGITLGTFTKWRQAHGQPVPTKDDLRNITDAETDNIFRDWYWLASGSDKLPWPLCLAHFDTAVNAGPGRAQEMLAKSNGNFDAYLGHLLTWYASIDGFDTFGRGWTRRRADLLVEGSK